MPEPGDARVVIPLLAQAQLANPSSLVTIVAGVLAPHGFGDVDVYLADHDLETLVAAPGSTATGTDRAAVPVDGSEEGRCFRSQSVVESDDDVWRVRVPVSESSERLGVLTATGKERSDVARVVVHEVAAVLGQLLANRDRYTDVFMRTRRRHAMQLQAEMQWGLLPPLAFACEGASVAGLLEPAYHIGGDSFDYALNDEVLHFGIFDSMGHDLTASMLTSLAVATYRNCRRERVDLVATLDAIDAAITSEFADKWVTLQLGELDTSTGRCRWVNAGHPLPLLVRERRIVGELGCPPCLPAGLGAHATQVAEVDLRPGDLLFFYTDGVIEARDRNGRQFGEDAMRDVLMERVTLGELPAEILRGLMRAVIEHQHERLRDDATAMLLGMHPTTAA